MILFPPKDVARRLASEEPVVVMARGHSGTRILAQVLDLLGVEIGSGPEKASADVGDARFARTVKSLARKTLHLPPGARPDPDHLARFRRHAWRYRRSLEPAPLGWGWKLPETYMIGNLVAATFPRARLLHMVRDGRDVAFKWHRSDRPDQRLGRRLLDHLDALDEAHHLQAARSWAFQVRRFRRFRESYEGPVHDLTFEELLARPEATVEEISSFLGLEVTPQCREYLVREIDPRKRAQHRLRAPGRVAEIEEAVGETLRELGYVEEQERADLP